MKKFMVSARVLVLGVVFAACAGQPDAVECPTGITCPEGTKCAAAQMICITNDCGDGIVQSIEVCDDGNILDGDGCAANCQSREACGDGVLNVAAGELCDDGNTMGGDGCAADCKSVEICGNGIRDVNEVCDDGNTVPGDGCSGDCKSSEVCGNGIVDINEKCDDGGAPGGCNDDCQGGTGCGDGAIDRDGSGNPLEECDDGNTDNSDDCTNLCRLNVCGDGIVQLSGARVEQCDPAIDFGETAGCNLDCTTTMCGDNKINNAAGEECDDGSSMNADDRDCTSTCQVNVCGDMKANLLGPNRIEQCDDGNTNQLDGCSNQCTTPTCGNGVREMGEACDDANTTNGDGCSYPDCQFEACGDGVVNNGEDCDAGTNGVRAESPTCNIDCTTRSCGDGKVNQAAGEECDDANMVDTDSCRNNCKVARCGDGVVGPGELCDDGNTINTDSCNNACTTQSCGDGIRQGAEECDDGNTSNTDGCLNSCVYATCGDSHIQAGVEQCDNGSDNGVTKNCLPTCRTNVCGDGFVDLQTPSVETCDDGNTTTETACPYGLQTCTLCNANCTATLNLTGNVCGDSVIAMNDEVCDDGNRVTETQCAYGTVSCTACNASCSLELNLSGPYCGDGTVQTAFEVCDDRSPTQSCGRCNNSCTVASTPTAASGIIVAPDNSGSNTGDGDRFTVSDGITSVTFELDKNGNTNASNIAIDVSGTLTATQVRDRIAAAFATARSTRGLRIDTTNAGASGLVLTNQRLSALGNQPISTTGISNAFFISSAMSGGAAGDCPMGTPCGHNNDCLSATTGVGVCTNNVCQ